ncbi:triple tyrosine motif-containing protein [Massilia sp. METH4]|uniref:sensor histidine kinase n=1 Tax=Massilia sp. METH4 TaxID=3123041 RepID=UPI0030D351CC
MDCRIVLSCVVLFWQFLHAGAVIAATPSFDRKTWGQAEGAPQAAYGVAQDGDGILWFPTVSGLYQFDGERFAQVDAVYGNALQSNNLIAAVAIPDGLAVSYQFGGVSVFTRGAAWNYGAREGLPSGAVKTLAADKTGTLYANTSTGVARLADHSGKWTQLDVAAMEKMPIRWIDVDDAGTLWAATDASVYAVRQGHSSFRLVASIFQQSFPSIIRGKLVAYAGQGRLVELSLDRPPVVFRLEAHEGLKDSPFEGPDGTWWAWLKGGTTFLHSGDDRAFRIAQDFEGGGVQGRMVMRTLVDRENNLWITTPEGVERYRVYRLHSLRFPYVALDLHVGRGLGDDMLVTNRDEGPVQRLAAGRMMTLPGVTGVSAMHRENADSVWLGGSSGVVHLTSRGIEHWPLPGELGVALAVQSIVTDQAGTVFVSIVRNGVYRLLDGRWSRVVAAGSVANDTPVCMVATPSGRIYLGYTAGRLAELTPDGIRVISTALADPVGTILSLWEIDGHLFAGGDRGVARLYGGKAIPLRPHGMAAFAGISGMAADHAGSLWLHGPKGLIRVPAEELKQFLAGQSSPVQWEVFNHEDGLRGQVSQIRPLPSLSMANDGRVYYATSAQVGWIDPAAIRRNPRAPTVLVTSLLAGGASLPGTPRMELPAGTTGVEIRFAATALSIPERVRFRYRLAGVDEGWQQPGRERAARYTNLAPGAYRFQVIAANEDGVWNDTGAIAEFSIAPRVWQTGWFRAIAIVLILLLGVVLYRWRIAAVARRAAERTAARMEERERIARNLHDNLLQGVQGLILNCHAVLMRMQAGTPEEQKLGEVLARADRLIEETRDEVMDLRGESAQLHLEDRLQELLAQLGRDADPVKLELTGRLDRLDAGSATEIFYILQEAITNSVRHSGAQLIRVAVDVTDDGVYASVSDNGSGMEPGMIEKGKIGHWGLTGMRERVHRSGGTLTIDSKAGAGTTVAFSIPARSVFKV